MDKSRFNASLTADQNIRYIEIPLYFIEYLLFDLTFMGLVTVIVSIVVPILESGRLKKKQVNNHNTISWFIKTPILFWIHIIGMYHF